MEKILELRDISKHYGNFTALNNISCEINEGTIVGLLGKNGAGKTTLMKIVLGLFVNYDGEIIYENQKLEKNDIRVKKDFASLVDVKFYEDMTAFQNLNYILLTDGRMNSKERYNKILDVLKIVDLEKVKNKKVKSFSFGMKQRLALAQVFLFPARIIILDEPFVGLDPVGIDRMKKYLKKLCSEGCTIIFSSHQLEDVSDLADNIIAIANGNVMYDGTLENLLHSGKKYVIWFENENEPQVILYDSAELKRTIYDKKSKGIELDHIDIEENVLYKLFISEE